jgi:hypothetical protein
VKRREFIAGLGSAAAWPLVARAQQAAMPVVGYLSPQSADDDYKFRTVPFLQGLKETGYVEGQDVAVEYRYAENQFDRLPTTAAAFAESGHGILTSMGTRPRSQAGDPMTLGNMRANGVRSLAVWERHHEGAERRSLVGPYAGPGVWAAHGPGLFQAVHQLRADLIGCVSELVAFEDASGIGRRLGRTHGTGIPETLLATADEVIQCWHTQ